MNRIAEKKYKYCGRQRATYGQMVERISRSESALR